MNLKLIRHDFQEKATEGILLDSGEFECYTLEDKDRKLEEGNEKVYGLTAIPRGEYEIVITHSPAFKRDLPLLLNVPGFEGIRIHKGNYSRNTEGCILVGNTNPKNSNDFIGNSKIAFDKLFNKIQNTINKGEKVFIEIV